VRRGSRTTPVGRRPAGGPCPDPRQRRRLVDRILDAAASRGAELRWRDHYWAEFNGFDAAVEDLWGNSFVRWTKGGDDPQIPRGWTGEGREPPMTDAVHELRPNGPRWTHLALRVADIDESIAWYTDFTPLELLVKREDSDGYGAWLGHPDNADRPFILVMAQFFPGHDPFAPTPLAKLAPFNHIAGCLAMPATEMGAPIGYICMLNDPDGNLIEFSYDQGVYEKAREVWGT
jgi:catechol 2,3-dioxygenase-like lactoylglutathione lyase family enzyme